MDRVHRSDFMDERTGRRRRRGKAREPAAPAARAVDYRRLVSPLPLATGYSDDRIARIHATALTVLQELGVRVNHAGARDLLARAGASVTGHQVRFGCEMVEAAIDSSPPEFTLIGANGTLAIGGRNTQFVPGTRRRGQDVENCSGACQETVSIIGSDSSSDREVQCVRFRAWQAGEENPRVPYERLGPARPTLVLRQRQIRDEVMSGGSQPTNIRMLHRRTSCHPRPESSTLQEATSTDATAT